MERTFNIPTRIFRNRRNKKGKLAIAIWLGVKFAFANSTKYNIDKASIKEFYHCGRKTADDIVKVMWSNDDLFYVNKRKNCTFAKSKKNKEVKRGYKEEKEYEYKSDDVISVKVPEIYLRDKEHKETLSLKELLILVDNVLICKEYDNQSKYKLSKGDPKGCEDCCETDVRKSMSYVAKKVGLKRTTLLRRVNDLVNCGYCVKIDGHTERCAPNDKNAIKGLNPRTRLPYWFVTTPTYLELQESCPFIYRHIIWDCNKRLYSIQVKSNKTLRKNVIARNPNLSLSEVDLQVMVQRQLQMRTMYD